MLNDKLKKFREAKGLSQTKIADMLNITRQAYNHYETGRRVPPIDTLKLISEIFNITYGDLLEENKKVLPKREVIKLPVYGKVAAGEPILAVDDIIDYIEVYKDEVNDGDYIAIQVKGDSMEPAIMSGDVVIVRMQSDVDSGSVAVVIINGDEATVKKLVKHKDGIALISNNTNYEPMFFSKKEINDLPVIVYGKVVELRRKF
ncbi:MAG: LexA family protein [Eubacteriales bacterium]